MNDVTKDVSTTTIVNAMQELIDEARTNEKLDIEKRVKLITACADRQLRAGALNLGFQRAISRLPENAERMIPTLNTLPTPPANGHPRQ